MSSKPTPGEPTPAGEQDPGEVRAPRPAGDPRWFTAGELPTPPEWMRRPPKPEEPTLFDAVEDEGD